MDAKTKYAEITTLIHRAIESEQPEPAEFSPQTELLIERIDQELKKILGLPSDYYL